MVRLIPMLVLIFSFISCRSIPKTPENSSEVKWDVTASRCTYENLLAENLGATTYYQATVTTNIFIVGTNKPGKYIGCYWSTKEKALDEVRKACAAAVAVDTNKSCDLNSVTYDPKYINPSIGSGSSSKFYLYFNGPNQPQYLYNPRSDTSCPIINLRHLEGVFAFLEGTIPGLNRKDIPLLGPNASKPGGPGKIIDKCALPAFIFASDGATFFKTTDFSYCGFASAEHLKTFTAKKPLGAYAAFSTTITDPGSFMKNLGMCPGNEPVAREDMRPVPAGARLKLGNNGTSSCSQFCAQNTSADGIVGNCLNAYREDIGKNLSCNDTPGLLSVTLLCTCGDSFVKFGNNGTSSCETYCAGSQWGQVGKCVSARREDTKAITACGVTPGALPNNATHLCWCEP